MSADNFMVRLLLYLIEIIGDWILYKIVMHAVWNICKCQVLIFNPFSIIKDVTKGLFIKKILLFYFVLLFSVGTEGYI